MKHIAFCFCLVIGGAAFVGCSPQNAPLDIGSGKSRELQSTVARPMELLQLNSLVILPVQFVEKERQHNMGDNPFYDDLVASFVADAGVEIKKDSSLLNIKGHSRGDINISEARAAGRRLKADGVLVTKMLTYVERVGSRVGVTTPAQIGFEMSIVSVASGAEIWNGTFHVADEAVLDNLLKLPQNVERGPRWRTAAEILSRGFSLAARDFGVRRREQFTS